MRGDEFIDLLTRHVRDQDEYFLPRKMIVADTSDGLVTLQEPVTGETYGEPFAATMGVAYEAGQEVMVLPIGGRALYVLPPVQRAVPAKIAFVAPLIGQVYADGIDATNAETNSNSDTATYVVGRTLSMSLPNGTYDVFVIGSANLGHSASGDVNLRLGCTTSGTHSSGQSAGVTTTNTTRVQVVNTFASVVVSAGTLVTTVEYKPGTAGTASCRNPNVVCHATRIG